MRVDRKLLFGAAHWRDCTAASKEELGAIASEYRLSPEMVKDCLDPDHLPKIERSAGLTFLMLRAYDSESPEDGTSVQEATRKVAVFWGDGFVLTLHRAPLRWIDELWADWERRSGREPSTLAALVQDLVEECLYTFEAPIDRAGLAVDRLEDTIFREEHASITAGHIVEAAYLAKKRATLFKRLLRLTRDLLPQLSKLGDPSSAVIQNLKAEADRLYFYSDDLVETAHDLVQLSISLTSNRTNQVVRVLTLVSIFLLPLNVVTGIYGMNFRHMPELDFPWAYPAVLLLMIVIEVGIYWVLKRRHWIR